MTGSSNSPLEEASTSFRASLKNAKDDAKKPKPVSVRQLFRFATPLDYFLMSIGALCGIANGGTMAAFSIILGQVFNTLNSPNASDALRISLIFIYVGIGTLVASTLQLALFTTTAERMTIRMREKYLESILSQDITFFDEQKSGSLTTKVAENAILFREALGEKMSQIFQFGAMFIGGL